MALQKFIEEAWIHRPQKMTEAEGADVSAGKWTASVWRLDQINLNGRIYSTELANRIVKENKTTTANDGHWADSASEYSCAKAVCGNPRIEHGELVVDIDFIDEEYEKKLNILADKGVAIGVSSAGWGECDETGRIVPETYELVRYLDFVTMPAGEVYAKREENEQKASETRGVEKKAVEVSAESKKLAHDITKILLRRKK